MQAVGRAGAVVGDAPSSPLGTPINGLPPKDTFLSVFYLVWCRSECGGGAEGSSIMVVLFFSPTRCLSGIKVTFKTNDVNCRKRLSDGFR